MNITNIVIKKSRNRIKKQVTPNPNRRAILQLNEKLIIDKNNRREYINSFNNWINSLVTNDILREFLNLNSLVRPEFHVSEDNSLFSLNNQNYGYFRLPVEIRWEENQQSIQRNLELVFRTDNLYVQGFIVNNNYYHFDFRNVDMNRQPAAVRDGTVPLLTQIEGIQSIQLTEIRPDYPDMIPFEDEVITWETIFNSFLRLTNSININEERLLGNLAIALGQIIFVTAESLRFWAIHSEILDLLIINNSSIRLGRNQNNVYFNLLVTWNDESRIQNLSIEQINNPLIFDQQIDVSRYFIGNVCQYLWDLLVTIANQPINVITNILGNSNVRVLLGVFIRPNLNNCKRQKRDLENDYWHKELCDLKPKSDNIQGEITVVNILDKDLKSNNLNKEDIFVGTTEGFYLIRENGIVLKAQNIDNSEIMSITKFKNNNFYVTTKEEHVYFLNTKFVNEGNLLGQRIWNAESSNLEKELKLYYDEKHQNKQLDFTPVVHNYWNSKSFLLNLDEINPIDNYEKLEFLGDVFSDNWAVKVRWGSWIYDDNKNNHKPEKTYDLKYYMKYKGDRNNKFHDIIENTKGDISKNKEQYLQSFEDWYGSAHILIDQRFGLTFYWDNRYYMKVFGLQYCEWWTSAASFDCHIKMGNGIKLYNDDEPIRVKREIFDINDLEEKNVTKWTDEFTKSINHEQHLAIDNKTNFVTNNITSL